MRIVSLLPSATEIVCALGLSEALVGVTHECDYPPEVRSRPIVTHSLLDHDSATSEEIDQAVRQQLQDGLSLYELDLALLAQIAPDLVLTQALCEVCAVAYSDVERAIRDISAAVAVNVQATFIGHRRRTSSGSVSSRPPATFRTALPS